MVFGPFFEVEPNQILPIWCQNETSISTHVCSILETEKICLDASKRIASPIRPSLPWGTNFSLNNLKIDALSWTLQCFAFKNYISVFIRLSLHYKLPQTLNKILNLLLLSCKLFFPINWQLLRFTKNDLTMKTISKI